MEIPPCCVINFVSKRSCVHCGVSCLFLHHSFQLYLCAGNDFWNGYAAGRAVQHQDNLHVLHARITLLFGIFDVCHMFPLLREIIKVAVVKRTVKVKVTKVVIFFIWLFQAFTLDPLVTNLLWWVSWFVVLALSILDSISLLAFCYREPSHESYALVLLSMMVAFAIGSIFSPQQVQFRLFFFILFLLSVVFCTFACRAAGGPMEKISSWKSAFLFIVAYLGGLIVTISSRLFDSKNKCYFPVNNHTADNAHFMNDQAPRDPICQATWTSVNLSIADLAGYLSYVAYQENWNKESLDKTINVYFLNLNLWSEVISYQVTTMVLYFRPKSCHKAL